MGRQIDAGNNTQFTPSFGSIVIQQQMATSSAREMVVFFADFLTDLTAVVANIKQHVYELIKVSIHVPKISLVYRQMSSIVFSAHRNFDDLKQIQSIVSGLVRARGYSSKTSLFSTFSHRFNRSRQQSEETQIIRSPTHRSTAKRNHLYFSESEKSVRETVKIGQRVKQTIKNQLVKIDDLEDQNSPRMAKEKDINIVAESSSLGKCVGQQGEQKSNETLSVLRLRIQQRLKSFLDGNKQTSSNFTLRNQACLKLINSAKAQLKAAV